MYCLFLPSPAFNSYFHFTVAMFFLLLQQITTVHSMYYYIWLTVCTITQFQFNYYLKLLVWLLQRMSWHFAQQWQLTNNNSNNNNISRIVSNHYIFIKLLEGTIYVSNLWNVNMLLIWRKMKKIKRRHWKN